MRGLRTWRGSVMALCVAVALAGLDGLVDFGK